MTRRRRNEPPSHPNARCQIGPGMFSARDQGSFAGDSLPFAMSDAVMRIGDDEIPLRSIQVNIDPDSLFEDRMHEVDQAAINRAQVQSAIRAIRSGATNVTLNQYDPETQDALDSMRAIAQGLSVQASRPPGIGVRFVNSWGGWGHAMAMTGEGVSIPRTEPWPEARGDFGLVDAASHTISEEPPEARPEIEPTKTKRRIDF